MTFFYVIVNETEKKTSAAELWYDFHNSAGDNEMPRIGFSSQKANDLTDRDSPPDIAVVEWFLRQ